MCPCVSSPTGPAPDDRLMIDYLIGALPDQEIERLDELSIADDQFAARLTAAENVLGLIACCKNRARARQTCSSMRTRCWLGRCWLGAYRPPMASCASDTIHTVTPPVQVLIRSHLAVKKIAYPY